jgi:hypothetical protein
MLRASLPLWTLQAAPHRQQLAGAMHESGLSSDLKLRTCQHEGWSKHDHHDADLLCVRMAEDLASWTETTVDARADVAQCVTRSHLKTACIISDACNGSTHSQCDLAELFGIQTHTAYSVSGIHACAH